jgi:hypothetical protein
MAVTKGKPGFSTLQVYPLPAVRSQEDPMRISLRSLSDMARWLTGAGALRNARGEVIGAATTVVDLESQLRRVVDPTPRRAA